MEKDAYFVLAYKIRAYLYECLKREKFGFHKNKS